MFVFQQIQVLFNFAIDWFSYSDSNPEMQQTHMCASIFVPVVSP